MSIFETIGILVGIGAGIIGILGFIYTIRTRQIDKEEQKLAAERQRRQLPDPRLCFYDYSLAYGKTYNIVIGIPHADYEKSFHLITQFPIAVSNIGGSELADFTIIFKHSPKSPLPISNDGLQIQAKQVLISSERHYYSDDESQCVSYKANKLMPSSLVVFKELMRVYPSYWKIREKVTTKDKIDVLAEVQMTRVFFFDVLVSFKDHPVKKVTFKLYAFECNNLEELEKILLKEIIGQKKNAERVIDGNYFLYYPSFQTIHKDLSTKIVEAEFDKLNFRRIEIVAGNIISERKDRSKENVVEL